MGSYRFFVGGKVLDIVVLAIGADGRLLRLLSLARKQVKGLVDQLVEVLNLFAVAVGV